MSLKNSLDLLGCLVKLCAAEEKISNNIEQRHREQQYRAIAKDSRQVGNYNQWHSQSAAGDFLELLELGNELFAKGRYAESLNFYNKAIANNPKLIEAYYKKALALVEMDKLQEAYGAIDTAIIINPRVQYVYTKGEILQAQGHDMEAMECYDYVIEQNSNHIKALTQKCYLLKKQSRFSELIITCKKLLFINPKNISALETMGIAQLMKQQPEAALKTFDKILTLKPFCSTAYKHKGDALVLMKKEVEALEQYQEAIQIDNKYKGALLNKATVLIRLERYQEALMSLDFVLQCYPDCEQAQQDKASVFQMFSQQSAEINLKEKAQWQE